MNTETVLVMAEKTINIDGIRGGLPSFTSEDAKHSMGGMPKDQFNYCEYVFLLHESKKKCLVDDLMVFIDNAFPEFKKKESTSVIRRLCEITCEMQLIPGVRVSEQEIFRKIMLTRGEWRYKWKSIYLSLMAYLNHLRNGVYYHIKNRTE